MLAGPLPELVDYRKLASQARVLEGSVPLHQLNRLRELLVSGEGDVYLNLAFTVGDLGRTRVQGQITAVVYLVCQHCLQQYAETLVCDVSVIVTTEDEPVDEQEDEDRYLVGAHELNLMDLVEEELLLVVPMIPRHPMGQCPDNEYSYEPGAGEQPAPAEDGTTHRPFANLAEVLAKSNKTEN